MVNTRANTKKTKNIHKTSSDASTKDTDQPSNESGDLIGSNDDISTEILIRLPASSILRFKSVSKHWLSLLSHKSFTVRYDKLLKSPGFFGYLDYSDDGCVYVPFDVENRSTPPVRRFTDCADTTKQRTHFFHSLRDCLDDPPNVYIIDKSCNGLLLCRSNKNGDIPAYQYFVFNPTTRQFAIIPPPLGGHYGYMNLAYHPTECAHYKIVCICTLDPSSEMFQIQIYSSDKGIWKISVEAVQLNRSSFWTFDKGVYWNGAIHWARSHLYFDVNFERLQTCPSPKDRLSSETLYFGESRGHLHIVVDMNYNSLESSSSALDVYEMLNDRSGWSVKHQVKLHELTNAIQEINDSSDGYLYDVMDVVRGEKEEDTFLVLSIPNKIIRYNVHDKSFKHICNDPGDLLYNNSCMGWDRYVETLTAF